MGGINSKTVSEMLEKRHDNLLRDIRKYIATLGTEADNYFLPSSYKDNRNTTRSCYEITKLGCDLIAGRLLGERSTEFRAKYTEYFNGSCSKDVNEYPVDEVAKLLGVSERSIYNWIKRGKLKAESREFEVVTTVTKLMVPKEEILKHKDVI